MTPRRYFILNIRNRLQSSRYIDTIWRWSPFRTAETCVDIRYENGDMLFNEPKTILFDKDSNLRNSVTEIDVKEANSICRDVWKKNFKYEKPTI